MTNKGFNNNLIFRQSKHCNSHVQEKQKKRKRKIIWFNPPPWTNVKTNNGKIFFNMGSIISAHNQRLLTPNNSSFGCNYRNKSKCPLEEKCLTPKVIYQADVTNNADDEYKFYYGLTESSFKERFRNHTKSFNHPRYQNETELSKYVWTLKHQNKTPTIKWKMIPVVNRLKG